MNELIESLERRQARKLPPFRVGDRVRVHFQVVEGTRRRTQVFEGVVLKQQGPGTRRTFTVRKLSFGVGVERTFPMHSPKIERVEVMGRGEVRRAKLYYLRGRIGRRARVRESRDFRPEEMMAGFDAEVAAEAAQVAADGAQGAEAPAGDGAAAGAGDEADVASATETSADGDAGAEPEAAEPAVEEPAEAPDEAPTAEPAEAEAPSEELAGEPVGEEAAEQAASQESADAQAEPAVATDDQGKPA